MIDQENSVNIKRNKKLLEQIRKDGEKDGGRIDSSTGYVEDRGSSDFQNQGTGQGSLGGAEGAAERGREAQRADEGYDQGIRSPEWPGEYPAPGASESYQRSETSVVQPPPRETPEQRAERAAELHRQRQQRYKDRQKAQESGQIEANMIESERETSASRHSVNDDSMTRTRGGDDANVSRPAVSTPIISWKLPGLKKSGPPEKVKLFSNKEADEALERMTEIYAKGSGLLDEVLEIVVKDHEPVSIWQLSDEEAETMAAIHLERAKVDEGAARAARKLMELYNRFYMYWLIGPRLKASGSYIKEHKGFSFK